MATRANKPEGAPAPKRTRRSAKSGADVPQVSIPVVASEAADMGRKTDMSVAPAAITVDSARIAVRAYELYEEGGWQSGHDLEHWFQAEAELRGRSER